MFPRTLSTPICCSNLVAGEFGKVWRICIFPKSIFKSCRTWSPWLRAPVVLAEVSASHVVVIIIIIKFIPFLSQFIVAGDSVSYKMTSGSTIT